MRADGLAYRSGRRGGDGVALRRLVVPLALALSTGGCGISMPIASLVPDETATGSIAARPAASLSADLDGEDWRRAKGALALALDPQGSGEIARWENPDTGREGSFAPVGRPFVKADGVCRAFRATLGGGAGPSSLQGTACRRSGPDWAMEDVKPAQATPERA